MSLLLMPHFSDIVDIFILSPGDVINRESAKMEGDKNGAN